MWLKPLNEPATETRAVEVRIVTASQVASKSPAVTPTARIQELPRSQKRLSAKELSFGIYEVLELAAAGRTTDARHRLRDLEIEATSGRSPLAVVDLGRREAKAVASLADGAWERLLVLALLWEELFEEYRSQRLGPLSEHSMTMSTRLAMRLARQAQTLEARREAADLLVSLSGSLLYAQRLGRTEELLELALKIDEKNPTALVALAATREQQGDFEGAIAVLRRLLQVDPGNDEGRLRLAVNLTRTRHADEAEDHLRDLVAAADQEWVSQVAAQEFVRLLASAGRGDEAVRVAAAASERWPDQPGMQIQLVWLLDQQNQPARAGDEATRIAQAAKGETESPRFRYHRWYLEGLSEVRQRLSLRSQERAREAVESMRRESLVPGAG